MPAPLFEEILPRVIATANADALVARETPGRFEIVLASGRIVRVPESFGGWVTIYERFVRR